MRTPLLTIVALLLASPAAAQPMQQSAPAPVKMWRLDGGSVEVASVDWFSDTMAYPPGKKQMMSVGVYLIKHGDAYMLWDTGFGAEIADKPTPPPMAMTMKRTLVAQLADLGIKPDQISIVGISHNHFDHIGQAASFPKAKLLIGKADLEALRDPRKSDAFPKPEPDRIKPWLAADSSAEGIKGDRDVFGDGTVLMLAMPGHTEGHHVLLVRLPKIGPVLLSGDQYHFTEQMKNHSVPTFNWNRAETLASHDRFDKLAANVKATVIIQHEPADIAKLPAFPQAAE